MEVSEHLGGPSLGATDDVWSRGDKEYRCMLFIDWPEVV
jgi:hypothetical protein